MARYPAWLALPIGIVTIYCTNVFNSAVYAGINDTGEKGAKIYCYMRQSGNEHEVSWNAAYEVIKRQANSLFKTSPKHGAVMIIETVVEEPENYEGCGSYLGDLFQNPELIKEEIVKEKIEMPTKTNAAERYNY